MRWWLALGAFVAGCEGEHGSLPDAAVDAAIDAGPGELGVMPMSCSFPNVCGADASFCDVTITNAGGPEAIALAFVGTGASEFRVDSTTCGTLAGGASCIAHLRFQPTSRGGKTAQLEIKTPSGTLAMANVDGTALSCGGTYLRASSYSLSFATVTVGSASASQSVTIENSANTITLSGLQTMPFYGADPGDFEVTSDTCHGATLAPSAECTIAVLFRPTAAGGRSAAFVVQQGSGGSIRIQVSGQGTP